MENKAVLYFRVSTNKQAKSGLGLDAQKASVKNYLDANPHEIIGEFEEARSGKNDKNRPALQEALQVCKTLGAKLIVAKLDRLSRDVEFIAAMQKSDVEFVVVDLPNATKMTIGIYAVMAMHERELISERTKNCFAPYKGTGRLGSPIIKRGERIPGSGGPVNAAKATAAKVEKADIKASQVFGEIAKYKAGHPDASLRDIAEHLNSKGLTTAQKKKWHATSISRILKRVQSPSESNSVG